MCSGSSHIENGSPDGKTDLDAELVSRISEEVNALVNAKFAETHQPIYESLTKVLDIIQEAPWAGETTFGVDSVSFMMETQKQCKSLSLEMRQLRQRWNQDLCKTEVRFGNLENALRATHNEASSDRNGEDRDTSILNEQMSKLEGLRAKLHAREASSERSRRGSDPTSPGSEERRKHCETAKNLLQDTPPDAEQTQGEGTELLANMELDKTMRHIPENAKVPLDGNENVPLDGNEGPHLLALEHHIQAFDTQESLAIALSGSCTNTKERRDEFDNAALRKLEKGAPAGA
jgi:hypothetical protein